MATPDIGTTIGDGYRRGFERLAAVAPSALIPAVVVGVIAGAISQLQLELVPDAGEIVAAAFRGEPVDALSKGDIAVLNALNAVSSAVRVVIGFAGLAVFGGLLHRARHTEPAIDAAAPHGVDDGDKVPSPGAVMGTIATTAGALMPKLGILVLLAVVGPLTTIVNDVLGVLVTLAALVATVYVGVRWTYAPIIAGSGEATGDAAFQRSEEAVEGDFWPTLGIMLVVGLAVVAPIVIVGAIIGAIIGGIVDIAFVSSFVSTVILMLGLFTLYASALESAWAQVEAGDPLDPNSAAAAAADDDFLAGPGTPAPRPIDPTDPGDAPRA